MKTEYDYVVPFESWDALLAAIKHNDVLDLDRDAVIRIMYHAPMDRYPQGVRVETRARRKVRVFPYGSDCDPFTCGPTHLDRFKRYSAALRQYTRIGCGFAGWYADCPEHSSSGGTLAGYLPKANPDHCLIYDASKAESSAFMKHILSGPIFAPLCEPNEIQGFDREAAVRMLPGLEDGFHLLTAAALAESLGQIGSLDRVGTAVCETLLRQIPGVKFYRSVIGAPVEALP